MSYFVVLNDFGFNFNGVFYMNGLMAVIPNDSDFFDPLAANLGNSNLK